MIAPRPLNTRLYGITLVAISSLLWSSAGFFTRLIDLDLWTLVAWRSLFACATLLIAALAVGGRDTFALRRRLGLPGLAYVPIAVVSMLGYIAALRLTSVANVMTIFATLPFLAAGLGWLLLRERLTRDALIASGVAFLGVLIMAGYATGAGDLAGNALALLMTTAFAATVVIARRWPRLDVTLALACASGLCVLVCAPLASPVIPDPGQLVQIFLFSLATQSLSFLLFMRGARHIPAAEAGLIALLDVVLGPLWVWLAFAERPGSAALVGGGLTLGAVLVYLLRQWRRSAAK